MPLIPRISPSSPSVMHSLVSLQVPISSILPLQIPQRGSIRHQRNTTMAGTRHALAIFLLALALLFCFADCSGHAELSSRHSNGRVQEERRNEGVATSWCIAKPSTDDESLNHNIDYSCRQKGVDCRPIQPGGSCFNPDSIISHASFAMNLFYKSAGKNYWNCHFNGTGLIVTQNPSWATCKYPT
ncbi:hypothetical protein AB3S75_025837 [Citrus x aurantiifolia]